MVKPMANWLSRKGRERRDKEIVRLRTQYHLTYEQIATRLGTCIAGVERALRKVRNREEKFG